MTAPFSSPIRAAASRRSSEVRVRAPAGRSRTAELELSGPAAAQLYVHFWAALFQALHAFSQPCWGLRPDS